jgi:hypothetical protein
MRRCPVGLGMDDWYQAPTSTARYPAVRKAGFALATCRIFLSRGESEKGWRERRHSVHGADRFDVKTGRSQCC